MNAERNDSFRERGFSRKIKRILKRRLLLLVILLLVLTAAGIIAVNIQDEYQTYLSSEAREYEPVSILQGSYLLVTEKKEFLGSIYAGFSIYDAGGNEAIYRCPDLYRVKDIKAIAWEEGSDSVLVEYDGEEGNVRYVRDGNEWEKEH